ncbi:MAG: murein transglycosylase A [Chroococcidiopsidaceae cyanobacterium CP_BM_ER_R8_30]|nr:murein transglycosylase A [Chroococcidiopsidaceae cyanobacterium CP_BM_ER_R8_30]
MTLSLGVTSLAPTLTSYASIQLRPVVAQKQKTNCCQSEALGLDEQIWGEGGQPGDKEALLSSIDNSLRYLQTSDAAAAYQRYPVAEFTRDRVFRSLERFRSLVVSSHSPSELQAAVRQEFVLYQSVGKDGKGDVLFTAYYEPIHIASRIQTPEYRYPLYRLPPDFSTWSHPQPTRAQLEGKDGLLGAKSRLHGSELLWMRDRLEAFLVQIEGSARFHMTDGTDMTLEFAGKTDYPYTSVGHELAKDGKLPLNGLTLPVMMQYFKQHPNELNSYLPRQRGFVFFKESYGAPATGSIGVPLTAERSIATDKSLMPPGALALIFTSLPFIQPTGQMQYRTVSRYVLDQDTGSAIKGPGRVDYFMGTGEQAGERAGVTGGNGQLYYLLLKE